jgi:HAD superfamily hydrolase (TIGR01509 family)
LKKLKINALLIDLDGTLVDPTKALLEAATAGYVAIGIDTFDAAVGIEIARRMEQRKSIKDLFSPQYRSPSTIAKFINAYIDAYYVSTLTKAIPLPNVHETLRTLSQSFPLAIVTLRFIPKKQITKELSQLKLLEYFKTVVTARDVAKPKPFPDAVIKGAELLGVKAKHCAVVGDSVVDIQAGKAAKAKTIAVLSGLYGEDELKKKKPNIIIPDISQLPKILTANP